MSTVKNIVPPIDWIVTPEEFAKYSLLFTASDKDKDGFVSGLEIKDVFLQSGIPQPLLAHIWNLCDTDQTGKLSLEQFALAMHFITKKLAGFEPPATLLPNMIPPSLRPPPIHHQGANQTSTILAAEINTELISKEIKVESFAKNEIPPIDWIVTPEEFAKYSLLFTATDKDKDGFVSGLEIKDVFLQSGIPQPLLAHIWNLCDTDQTGKLSLEQFALAMHFISKKLAGFEPPATLLPNMIPPSLRSSLQLGANQTSASLVGETNPEFELITKEIRELQLEREAFENEIAAKENEKKVKSSEMRSLQNELDILSATLKQLENQKGVAGSKLGELAAQVDSLRTQAGSQEETLSVQEGEVNEKLKEYNSLNEEEVNLEKGTKETQETIEKIILTLQETQLAIGQAKSKISSLSELKENMDNLTRKFDEVIENGNVYSITEPELVDLVGELNELIGEPEQPEVNANNSNYNSVSEDPFANNNYNGSQFMSSAMPVAQPYVEEDPFAALHAPPPLSSSSPWSQPVHDPFAPVAGGSIKHDFSPGKDPFGHEPFSLPEESPALPAKKAAGKAPPPRPAPPRGAPARPPPPLIKSLPQPVQQQQNFTDHFGQGDPFGNGDHGDFADFSQFDQKFNSGVNSFSSSTLFVESSSASSPWGPSSSSAFSTSSSGMMGKSITDSSMFGSTKTLDFTEDPFKNYRYEDPFALADVTQSWTVDDPFSQSNSHVGSQLHGSKTINNNNTSTNNNNNNNNSNTNKNAHHKNGFL